MHAVLHGQHLDRTACGDEHMNECLCRTEDTILVA